MSKKSQFLNQYITGAVYESANVLDAYSTDRSILKIRPSIVAVPHSVRDLRKLLRFSSQLAAKNVNLPVTVRGSGLSDTGASIGSGILISMEKINHIQEIDAKQRLLRIQSGATLGEVNSALALHGLTIPVDADPRKTIGSLISEYYCSPSAHRHGSIVKYISQAEIVLANGDTTRTGALRPRQLSKKKGMKNFEGEIYRKIDAIISDNPDVIEQIAVNSQNRAGYPLLPEVKNGRSFDLLPLMYGAQGSLGVLTELILKCEYVEPEPQYFAAIFEDFDDALDFIDMAGKLDPSSAMLYDLGIFASAAESGKRLRLFKKLPENGTLIIVAFDDNKKRKFNQKIKKLRKNLPEQINHVVSNDENYQYFTEINSILSVFLNNSDRGVRLPIIDGVSIPRSMLKNFLVAVAELEDQLGINIPIYGSVLTETYTARPLLRLETVMGRQEILSFLRAYASIVRESNGHLAGTSAEGRLRAIHANLDLSPEVIELYKEIKKVFDPNNILNPGIKQDATARAVVRQLRTGYNQGVNT